MANKKISQLEPKNSNLDTTDLIEISELNGANYISKSILGDEILNSAKHITTQFNIDLSIDPYNITNPGVYSITNGSLLGNSIEFPNPTNFLGRQIIIINLDPNNLVLLGSSYSITLANGSVVTNIPISSSSNFISISSQWVKI